MISKENKCMEKIKKRGISGFTLMEIIVVIAIVAILVAIAIPTLTGYIEKAKESSDLQVATNIVRATQTSVTLYSASMPDDAVIEVLWATGYGASSGHQNKLLIREVTGGARVSELRPADYGGSKISTSTLQKIQESVIETMGYTPVHTAWGDAYAFLEVVKSDVARENNFAFHINVGTGEVALAYHSVDGTKNIWIDEIGVNITPVP